MVNLANSFVENLHACSVDEFCSNLNELAIEDASAGEFGGLNFLGAVAVCVSQVWNCLDATHNQSYSNAISNCFSIAESDGANAPVCISSPIPLAIPTDPNNLTGPAGIGGQRWIIGAAAMTYGISFSNEPTALVRAQQVVVTQPLGATVDINALTLLGITLPNGSASVQVPVPPGSLSPASGINEFTTVADLRPTQSLLVNVDAKLNTTTRTLTWTLSSIDPITGLPPVNPLVGVLPPGLGGSAAFSVTPRKALTTGAQISDQASVVFDANAPLSTATWTNTIDNSLPTSQIAALPVSESCPNFKVSWSGNDVGSGLAGFTVYSSDNSGQFAPWLTNTTATSGTFIGALGHTYSFYSIAQDLVGNIEGGHSSANTTTQVTSTASCTPPSLSAQVLSTTQSGTTVTVSFQLTNTGLTTAQSVNISQIAVRTLSGSGTVTLNSPAVPASEGPLAVGAFTTVPLVFTVPSTVTRFSLTESGNLLDANSKSYSYSLGQVIIP